jgi:hypothetical protein
MGPPGGARLDGLYFVQYKRMLDVNFIYLEGDVVQ